MGHYRPLFRYFRLFYKQLTSPWALVTPPVKAIRVKVGNKEVSNWFVKMICRYVYGVATTTQVGRYPGCLRHLKWATNDLVRGASRPLGSISYAGWEWGLFKKQKQLTIKLCRWFEPWSSGIRSDRCPANSDTNSVRLYCILNGPIPASFCFFVFSTCHKSWPKLIKT